MSCSCWRQRAVATYGVQGRCDGIQTRSAEAAEEKEAEERGRGKRGSPPKGGAQCELVDKPGSVADDHSSATSVTARL